MFVASPTGAGIDTIRLWEVLHLGSIPVVTSSTLDGLYDQYPVIIIESWASVNETSMSLWQSQILQRFGQQPFSNVGVKDRLSLKYWVDLVRNTSNRSSSSFVLDAINDDPSS